MKDIKSTIKSKINEHEKEMVATLAEQDRIKATLEDVQKKGNVHELMLESNKVIVLKDKALFHKAAVMVLNDLLESINE